MHNIHLSRNLKGKAKEEGHCLLGYTPHQSLKVYLVNGMLISSMDYLLHCSRLSASFLSEIDLYSFPSFFLNLAHNYCSFSLNQL
jgi:hypothetical protein